MKNKLSVFLTLFLISNMAFSQNNQIGGRWVERQSDNQHAIIAVNKLDRQYTWVVSSYSLDKAQQEMSIFYRNNQNQNQTLHTGEGAGSIFESNGNVFATVQHQNSNLELGGDWRIVDFDKKPFAQMNFDIGESFNRERTLFKFKNPVLFVIETKDIVNCNKFTIQLITDMLAGNKKVLMYENQYIIGYARMVKIKHISGSCPPKRNLTGKITLYK